MTKVLNPPVSPFFKGGNIWIPASAGMTMEGGNEKGGWNDQMVFIGYGSALSITRHRGK
jgi:hypothetical protein